MKRLLSLGISLVTLAVLYASIDVRRVGAVFASTDVVWLIVAALFLVPLTLLSAWRLQLFLPSGARLGLGKSTRLILAASSMNAVLPSKMGDIAKAYFMRRQGHLTRSAALCIVVFEKMCDMLALLCWCVVGFALRPPSGAVSWLLAIVVMAMLAIGTAIVASSRLAGFVFLLARRIGPKRVISALAILESDWYTTQLLFWQRRGRLATIILVSLLLWYLHLLQIWTLILALSSFVPSLANLSLAPLAILGGLVPLTFAGIGTRDAAIVYLYRDYLDPATAAALGLLCTMRYFLPAIAGLPFLGNYIANAEGTS